MPLQATDYRSQLVNNWIDFAIIDWESIPNAMKRL